STRPRRRAAVSGPTSTRIPSPNSSATRWKSSGLGDSAPKHHSASRPARPAHPGTSWSSPSASDSMTDTDSHIAPLRGETWHTAPWQGRGPHPWDYQITAAIPVLDTPDELALVVELLRLQTERPF